MSKEISMKKFDRKFTEAIDCKIEDSVCVQSTKDKGAVFIGGKRIRIDKRLFMAITPDGNLEILNPDDISFVIKPKFDEDFTAFFSFAGETHKFSWKQPYDLPFIFVGIFKSDDIIIYVTLSKPICSGNLSGVYLDCGFKGTTYQKVLELASSELSTITSLINNADRYTFDKILKSDLLSTTIDANNTTDGGDEYED